jgi:hypothetical protein
LGDEMVFPPSSGFSHEWSEMEAWACPMPGLFNSF